MTLPLRFPLSKSSSNPKRPSDVPQRAQTALQMPRQTEDYVVDPPLAPPPGVLES